MKLLLLYYFCAMNTLKNILLASLLVFALLNQGFVVYAQQTTVGTLPSVINESSGLAFFPENDSLYWSHNDSGGLPALYLFNVNGQLVHTLQVTNFTNIDWEDLAQDNAGNLYVGEFGNNSNNRTDLKILKVPVTGLPNQAAASAITYNYPDQTLFPPPPNARNFDMEAMIYRNDTLFLFSKNVLSFTVMGTGYSKLYAVPATPGNYTAELIDSLYTFFQATAADIAPSGKAVALLCYSRLYILHSFTGNNFFNGLQQMYQVAPLFPPKQTEAVVFRDCSSVYITAESGEIILYDFSADFPPPALSLASNSVTICAGQTAELFASGGNSYDWQPASSLDNPSSATPVALPLISTTYTVKAYNQIGCSDTKQVLVTVENCPIATKISAKLWLEGAFNNTTGTMSTYLNSAQLLPLSQPFNRPPWNYPGTEGLSSPLVLPSNIVDWVLVEVRDAGTQQVVARRAALLQADGFVTDVAQIASGSNVPRIYLYGLNASSPYFVSIKTRNHLAVMSVSSQVLTDGLLFNFTQPANVLYGVQQLKQIGSNYTLYAADSTIDGVITFADFNKWVAALPVSGVYSDVDFNYDGVVNTADYQLYRANISRIGVPAIRD